MILTWPRYRYGHFAAGSSQLACLLSDGTDGTDVAMIFKQLLCQRSFGANTATAPTHFDMLTTPASVFLNLITHCGFNLTRNSMM